MRPEVEKNIATNPTAKHDFFIEEVLEAGIVLTGTEIKSLRTQAATLKEAWIEITGRQNATLEAWIVGLHIPPYSHGNIYNHEPLGRRKLLLHRKQIEHLFGATIQKGMALVPVRIYLAKGRAKIELGLGKGKKKHDKRDSSKEKDAKRDMDRAMKR